MNNTTQPSATRPRGSAKFAEPSWYQTWLKHSDGLLAEIEENARLRDENARLTKLNGQLFACWLHRLGGGK